MLGIREKTIEEDPRKLITFENENDDKNQIAVFKTRAVFSQTSV